jgi:hypothetical protein
MLSEIPIPIKEILKIEPSTLIDERQRNSIVITRTTIDELGLDVLNLFSPIGQIFWSFGLFAAQAALSYEFATSVSTDALQIIKSEQRHLNLSVTSINAFEFFGSFTRGQGDVFYPYDDSNPSIPYWWFAQRHICLSCPTEQYDRYIDYFTSQLDQIGSDCFRAVADDKILVDISQYRENSDYNRLQMYVTRMSPSERESTLRALMRDDFLQIVNPGVVEIAGCRGEGQLALLESIDNFDDADCIRGILVRRAELAAHYMALPNVEAARIQLSNERICSDSQATEKMISALDCRLRPFPVIRMSIE